MTLKKLTQDHYIIVDDSKIKEGDWLYSFDNGLIVQANRGSADTINSKSLNGRGYAKITHSTNIITNGMGILYLSEVKELIGEVDVEKDYVLSRLCVYDKRNPDYIPYDEDDKLRKPTDCSCDNCFYGRTILSEKILQLNQALEDNKEKKYTEEDIRDVVRLALEDAEKSVIWSKEWYPNKLADKIIQSLQPKTEWEVEFVDGKLKLK